MRKAITILLACVCIAACVAPAAAAGSRFDDVKPTDWFYDAVEFVVENGLMIGVSDSSFEPDEPTTRAMLVTVLWRLENRPPVPGECPFPDVEAGEWYADAVTWASEHGIVLGYDDGTFRPDGLITREQFVTILYRYDKTRNK